MPIDFETKKVTRFHNPPQGEQELIRGFFHNRDVGYYVDVGANEPVIGSQTRHLEQLGWEGLLLEPLPHYCELLRQQRKGTVVQHACSSPENHNKTLTLIVAGGHSTLNRDPIAIGTHSQETIEVICKTLDSILEDNEAPIGFDFISIDIEGHEMEMFKGFTLSKWKPRLVLLEDHVTSHDKHDHMVANGYQVILRTGLNSWYVPVSESYHLSLISKLEFFRKYWLGLWIRKIRYRREGWF
ncbi:FkbM family methyltransferase [Nitrospina watsonii]|uniref:Methyltransferase FkbM n=1 Tax=Nitrospina watsonii TaxID=1323948 RepID=A0ABN8W210_9BACT|nr:FkbM family methyltransferase [Nitrospina watsonii]CAI2719004.1 Methyltransferase FkbM [Nitrospina watsonii]